MKLALTDDMLNTLNTAEILGIYLYQDNGKFVFANEAFLKFLGYTQEELIQKTLFEVINKSFIPEAKETINRRLKGEEFAKEYKEFEYITKDGMTKPALIFSYTVIYNGKPAGLVINIDILKEKLYEVLYRITHNLSNLPKQLKKDELLKSLSDVLIKEPMFDIVVAQEIKGKTCRIISVKSKDKSMGNTLENIQITLNKEQEAICGLDVALKFKRPVFREIELNTILSTLGTEKGNNRLLSMCTIPLILKRDIYLISIFSKVKDLFSVKHKYFSHSLQTIISSTIERIEVGRINLILNKAINENFDMVILVDRSLKIAYINDAAADTLNISCEKLIDSELNELIPEINLTKLNSSSSQILRVKVKENPRSFLFHIAKINIYNETYYLLVAKDIKENILLEAAIENYFKKDQLTGLLNRKAFLESIDRFIKRARLRKTIGALLVIDPLHFSNINEAFGLKVGDRVLIEIGKRLVSFLRDYDLVAKLESERFGVFLKEIEREEDIYVISIRLLDFLSKPYVIGENSIRLSFNLGISIYPTDAKSAEELIDKAQVALSDAKAKKDVSIGFYRDELKLLAQKNMEIQDNFTEALRNGEFKLFLQPYFKTSDFSLGGAEALVRWIKNGRTIQPIEFIPTLEKTNLIVNLDEYMFDRVVEFLSTKTAKFPVSVNISPGTLYREDFVEHVINRVKNNNIENLLNIEITERMVMNNADTAIAIFKKLKDNGICISIDDFGTGYSSLSYLARLPVDFVKIDLSFIKRMLEDRKVLSVVKTIIYLAKELGMKTIAEGVENEKQIGILKDLGCDYLQGFYFSKPIPKEEIMTFVK